MPVATMNDQAAQAELDAELDDLVERMEAVPRPVELESGAREAAEELRPAGRAHAVLAYMDWIEQDAREALRRRCAVLAEAIPGDYSTADVLGWHDRALAFGPRVSEPRFGAAEVRAVFRGEKVPNAPLREALEREVELAERWDPDVQAGILAHAARTIYEQGCRRAGLEPDPEHRPDTSHVARSLGMDATTGGASVKATVRTLIHHELAADLADALGLSYHHAGV